MNVRLRKRDYEILREIARHGIIRRDDLIRLGYFGSIPRCNSRLSQLVGLGLLRPIRVVNGLHTRQSLYVVTPAAHELMSAGSAATVHPGRRKTSGLSPMAIEHSIRILDFRHMLNVSFGNHVAEWLAEPECYHDLEFKRFRGDSWRPLVFKPDACFEISSDETASRYFLEMDLGHVSLPRFASKLSRYGSYLDSGAFSDIYENTRFSVLTVTTGERRCRSLTSLSTVGFDHVVTTWTRMHEHGLTQILPDNGAPIVAYDFPYEGGMSK